MTGLRSAERDLIGALLRQPALSRHELFDGQTLPELVTPAELVNDDARRLYKHVHARLHDEGRLSLNELLVDLAYQDDGALADLATGMEAEVDQRCQGNEESLLLVFRGAVERILGHHSDRQYERTRAAASSAADVDGQQLLQVVEHRRANYRPSSIGRPGRT